MNCKKSTREWISRAASCSFEAVVVVSEPTKTYKVDAIMTDEKVMGLRSMTFYRAGIALSVAMGLSFGASAQGTLEERVEQLLPNAEENRFMEIDWQTDLLKAREKANNDGKPMFMWMMNGHPFGAT